MRKSCSFFVSGQSAGTTFGELKTADAGGSGLFYGSSLDLQAKKKIEAAGMRKKAVFTGRLLSNET